MSTRIDILTPVGRLVQGDCYTPNKTDAEGKPLVVKHGPNAGQPREDYYLAIAVPKTDPGLADLQQKIRQAAQAGFPNLFDAQGNCSRPDFAFKWIDGDSQVPNRRGVKPCDCDGFPGHVVFRFSSGFAPKVYIRDHNGKLVEGIQPGEIKRGYYVRIAGNVSPNDSPNQPGVFLNHNMIERVAFGEEIVSGPDGHAVFGEAAPVAPAGASATPLAPASAPAVPGAAPAPAPPAAPAPAGVAPAPEFLNPPAPPAPPAAPAPEPMYRAGDGNAYSAAQLTAAGYSQAQIDALPRA